MKNSGNLKQIERKKLRAIISFLGMIALGILTSLVEGGLLGEEFIYNFLGGQDRNAFLLAFAKVFALIGSPKFLVPVIPVAFGMALYFNRRILALGLIISSLGSFILNQVVKAVFRRPRPLAYMLMTESSFSFPSGHTVTSTCIYMFLAYYFSQAKDEEEKIYYIIALIFSILMGLSRIFLGVHYITDVLGGFLNAYFFNYVTIEFLKKSKYKL